MKVAIRGFTGGHRLFEDVLDYDDSTDMQALVAKQMKRVLRYPQHMIEFEFLEEPNPQERFFRFGSDPNGMVKPIAIKL